MSPRLREPVLFYNIRSNCAKVDQVWRSYGNIARCTVSTRINDKQTWDPFYLHGLTLIPPSISNYIPYTIRDEISDQLQPLDFMSR